MGANAQTEVPAFTAGQILTAAEMTQVNTGIPVFATTTTRDAAFGGTGEKVLAEGQFAYIEATNTTQYYDGAAWVAVGASGLTLVKTQTIGAAVSSVSVTNAFSATYENYLITISGGVSSVDTALLMSFGATTSGYRYSVIYMNYSSNSVNGLSSNTAANWYGTGSASVDNITSFVQISNPFQTKHTTGTWSSARSSSGGENVWGNGALANTTSYTDFTVTTNGGTITGGTIRVYGYQNS